MNQEMPKICPGNPPPPSAGPRMVVQPLGKAKAD
jgi:hypothetical protein